MLYSPLPASDAPALSDRWIRDGRNRQFAQGPQARRKRARCSTCGRQSNPTWALEGGANFGGGSFRESTPNSRRAQDRHGRCAVKSPVVKRSIVIARHKTSVSLEDAFWSGLKDIAASRNVTLSELVASIDTDRRQGNLSSAIRLFVLDYYRALAGG